MGRMKKVWGNHLLFIAFTLLNSTLSYAALSFYENSSGSPVFKLINSAKESIDIEIYEMKDEKVHAAIKAALERGVKVRIIQEPTPVGACRPFSEKAAEDDDACTKIKNFIYYVKSKGGTYVPFDKRLCGFNPNCFQHGKMLIVDRAKVLTSTGNFNASSLCDISGAPDKCNRDYSLVDDNPKVLKTLQEIFDRDLNSQATDIGTVLEQHGTENTLTVSPTHSLDPMLMIIDSAKSQLIVENQYLKEPTMNEAIMRAAKRGVKVFVMVTSVCAFANGNPADIGPSEVKRWTQTYSAFEKAGVISRAFSRKMTINGKPGYLHAKAVVADKKLAWVGSTNGSTMALTNNREFGTFTKDPKIISALYNIMVKDINHEYAQTWQESLKCKNDQI